MGPDLHRDVQTKCRERDTPYLPRFAAYRRSARLARMKRAFPLATGAVGSLAVAAPAFAHTAERGFVMLLPTDYYMVGGALAVAASFVILALAPARRPAADAPGFEPEAPPGPLGLALGTLSFLLLATLVAAGLLGTRDPLLNPLPLAVWTGLWIALTLAHALLGDLWRWINPWTAPLALCRGLFGAPPLRLPDRLGHGPAILLFFAFAWFELVDPAPDDPARLARAVGGYWLFSFAMMLLVGEADWRRRGEFLSVFFGFIARLAPLARRAGGGIALCPPGAKILRAAPVSTSAACFVLLALASVSFDGLSRTFRYLDWIDVNPLEFPGRSAVLVENTAGLALAALVLGALFFLMLWLGQRLAGPLSAAERNAFVLTLLPISLAYHFSHYLPVLLVNAQYGLKALGDPFATGANWLGLAGLHVTTSFFADFQTVETIWIAQSGAIVLGHVWAVGLAHGVAIRHYGDRRRAALMHAPLAAGMVGYTVFGLWLLSAPTGV